MITEKNKEEIERLEKEIKLLHNYENGFYIQPEDYIRIQEIKSINYKGQLKSRYEATIETSIQWCEDEIEDNYKYYKMYQEKILKLNEHLKWLKEQEKEL